jgi:hypothetical protein
MYSELTDKLTDEMKNWFGDGEFDIDLMLKMGVVTEEQIIKSYNEEHAT